ncbi:hypothetical protein [Calothrix sp. CCY 0018]|uniref:hypothetical protein n=1 Tax=Calothrix sp. CCY 0018 TaxID=3103864 RepID=UPI0039C70A86
MKRCELQLKVQFIRNSIKSSLQEAANYEVGYKEKTPFAKTVRTCRQLLKVEPALWLFVDVEGVEPTNNTAQRRNLATGSIPVAKFRSYTSCGDMAPYQFWLPNSSG